LLAAITLGWRSGPRTYGPAWERVDTDHLAIVIVGDRATIEPMLRAAAPHAQIKTARKTSQ
jgi:hypothetical protein